MSLVASLFVTRFARYNQTTCQFICIGFFRRTATRAI